MVRILLRRWFKRIRKFRDVLLLGIQGRHFFFPVCAVIAVPCDLPKVILASKRDCAAGATYNFGQARVFGLYTQTNDAGLGVRSRIASAGLTLPLGPATLQAQAGYTTARGSAVDRRHTTLSAAYLYPCDSVTDIYLVGMDDRVRGRTVGRSVAAGVRFRF